MQVMLERIAALEAMLQQAPIVSGRFTAAPYLHLAKPLHQDMSAAMAAASQLGRQAASPRMFLPDTAVTLCVMQYYKINKTHVFVGMFFESLRV